MPYARMLGGGPLTVGLLMTAMPAGTVIGALVIGRLSRPDEQLRMIGALAMLSCAPLAVSLLRPPVLLLVPLLVLAGAGGAYQIAAAKAFVAAVPNGHRDRAFGIAQSGLLAAQGLGILVAGAAAHWISPPTVVAIAGLLGMTGAALLATDWPRHRAVLAGLAVEPGGPPPAAATPAAATPAAAPASTSGSDTSGSDTSGPDGTGRDSAGPRTSGRHRMKR